MSSSAPDVRLIDCCVNLADDMFQGRYNDKQKHDPDFDLVLERATAAGVQRMIGVSGSLSDSQHSIKVAKEWPNVFATVGVHPTRCTEFEEAEGGGDEHLGRLLALAKEGGDRVVAIGEIGLDYDRTQFCDKDVQMKWFLRQLELAKDVKLPIIFHNRNTGGDFERVVREHREDISGGVVHSFTGDVSEMQALCDLGLYIGINGCALKTEEGLEMARQVPLNRLVLETDAPWCGLRPSGPATKHVKTKFAEVKRDKFVHGTMVKDRQEPAHTLHIAEVLAAVKGVELSELAEATYANTINVLFPAEAA